jgi:hypothetical protein
MQFPAPALLQCTETMKSGAKIISQYRKQEGWEARKNKHIQNISYNNIVPKQLRYHPLS